MIRILSVYGTLLLRAMGQTLLLALSGLFFACILGLVFGLLSVVKSRICNAISTIFVDVIRGVPMIVLAFMIYFGVPQAINGLLTGSKFTLTALQAGTVALALNCGAYMAEIIRAGIQSVDPGQMEAARSLGLPYWRAMAKVVLPQAIRTMIPSIINQFIITLKDTSILSVIGFPELTVSIANTTEKEISAIQFYAIPYDVYGDEITGWTSQKNLYTDKPIKAGASTKVDYQLIEESVKTVKLYVYSVYYADGTEWGDKDAFESEILEKGVPINVTE